MRSFARAERSVVRIAEPLCARGNRHGHTTRVHEAVQCTERIRRGGVGWAAGGRVGDGRRMVRAARARSLAVRCGADTKKVLVVRSL